ncbi:Hypothetical predicted protein [Olea europaea subsp. europaea]|uniref:Uncharacterized protein n=1 Tax=Olea europaea subsp. europaea TaxID=158383 RepID=A0A8S0TCF5_OLEEU|nr:Hypothetical predicted protein [Olea europaea subsp. europaea]
MPIGERQEAVAMACMLWLKETGAMMGLVESLTVDMLQMENSEIESVPVIGELTLVMRLESNTRGDNNSYCCTDVKMESDTKSLRKNMDQLTDFENQFSMSKDDHHEIMEVGKIGTTMM